VVDPALVLRAARGKQDLMQRREHALVGELEQQRCGFDIQDGRIALRHPRAFVRLKRWQ
jgi:hypothetical protein